MRTTGEPSADRKSQVTAASATRRLALSEERNGRGYKGEKNCSQNQTPETRKQAFQIKHTNQILYMGTELPTTLLSPKCLVNGLPAKLFTVPSEVLLHSR